MRHVIVCLAAAAIAAAAAALPAAAKEGVEATLVTRIPLDAKPGTELQVAWRLGYARGQERGRPFGANGVFVRLVSASGARPETGFAPSGAYTRGEYAARVVVPEGGIGDVEIGLLSWTSDAAGTRRGDLLFPITNDPVPARARVASPPAEPTASASSDDRPTAWIVAAGLAVLIAMCSLGVAVAARRRRARHA